MATRAELIRTVWPDKLLYACIMLVVTGLVGALYSGIVLAIGIKMSPKLPAILRTFPPLATLALSLASVGLAWLAMRRVQTLYGFLGALAGIASLGLLGVGSFFALVALGFLAASRIENEEERVRQSGVGPEAWPDKSLAASLLLLVAGGVTIAWGVAVLANYVTFTATGGKTFAFVEIALGLVAVAASFFLYQQRGMWIGVAAAVGVIAGLGAYVLAPLLGVGALWAIRLASREREFDPDETPASA